MREVAGISRAVSYFYAELGKERAFLLPLRLFMGLGWVRTGAVKFLEPDWFSGDVLASILSDQVVTNEIYFPFYELLISSVFLPNIALLAWIIFIGEMLVGVALITGTLTNAALLGALFMNVNFVLAGWVNPSAFYIVIQVVLFAGGAGTVLGIDSLLSERVRSVFLTSQTRLQLSFVERRTFLILTVIFWIVGIACLPFARDYGPSSVDDPAMLLFITMSMTGITTLSVYFLSKPRPDTALSTEPILTTIGDVELSG